MSTVDEIQDAEKQVADLQDTLGAMQHGLERAEEVAVAAEQARERSEMLVKVSLGLIVTSILLIVLSRRRRASD